MSAASFACALDRLGDPLDPLQPGVPGGADRGQLRDGSGELGVVDAVALLPARRGRPHHRHPVEDVEMLRHRLPGDRQLLAQRGGGAVAVGEQQVEDPSPGRVADRRPEVVVDALRDAGRHGRTPRVSTYGTSRGRIEVPARVVLLVLLLEDGDLPAHLAEAGLGHLQQGAGAGWGQLEGDEQRVAGRRRFTDRMRPAERERSRWLRLDDGELHRPPGRHPRSPKTISPVAPGSRLVARLVGPPLLHVIRAAHHLEDDLR